MTQLITKARTRVQTLAGGDLACIYLPLQRNELETLLQTNEYLQFLLTVIPAKFQLIIQNTNYSKKCFIWSQIL